MDGKHDGLACQLNHRNQILERIVVDLEDMSGTRHAVGCNEHSVAVGRALGCRGCSDAAIGSGHILDHGGLAESLTHEIRHEPGAEIRRSARREWDDELDRSR